MQEKTVRYEIVLPKGCDRQYTSTIARVVGYTKSTVPRRMKEYEAAFPDFSALNLEEREADCTLGLATFRHLLETCPLVETARTKVNEPCSYYHFVISYPDYVEVCKKKDMLKLNKIMLDGGGFCDEIIYNHITDGVFKDHIAQQNQLLDNDFHLSLIGSAEIALNLHGDVKRVCFLGLKTPPMTREERDEVVRVLTPSFPNASEFLTNDIQAFLKNPQTHPEVLSSIMERLQMEDYTCAMCGQSGKNLPMCSKCRKVWYCGKDCQQRHWKEGGHKNECK